MPEYIQYSDSNGRIIDKWYSADPSIVEGKPNILQIPRDTFNALTKYYIVVQGALRPMTQAEKDALDAEEVAAARQALLNRIDKYDVSNLDILTALVKRINVRIPANPITKDEIVAQLKADMGV